MRYAYKHAAYTAAEWAEINPVIAENEIVLEKETDRFKIGDGFRRYLELPFKDASHFFNKVIFDYTYENKTTLQFWDNIPGYIKCILNENFEEYLEFKGDTIYGVFEDKITHDYKIFPISLIDMNMYEDGYMLTLDITSVDDELYTFTNEVATSYEQIFCLETINEKIKQESIKGLVEKLNAIEASVESKKNKSTYIYKVQHDRIQWHSEINESSWINIPLNILMTNYKIEVDYFVASFQGGEVKLPVQVRHKSSNTNNGTPSKGFFIRDTSNKLIKGCIFDYIELHYTIILDDVVSRYDSRQLISGKNVINSANVNDVWHSNMISSVFKGCFPLFDGMVIDTITDPLTLGVLNPAYQPKFTELKQADMIIRPYLNASLLENVGSNPNVIEVASHYDNSFTRHDLTTDEATFLSNVIAVGARVDDMNTSVGCTSYGFGLEFFEIARRASVNEEFPDKVIFKSNSEVNVDATGFKITAVNMIHDAAIAGYIELGDEIYIDSVNSQHSFVQSVNIVDGYHEITLTTPIAPQSGLGHYMYYKARVGDFFSDTSSMQSEASAVVAAKFKNIQQETNASWQIVRLAARATASNQGEADIYRGFGIINVTAAIQYIKNNYTDNSEFKADLAEKIEFENQKYRFLNLNDLGELTPVPKKFTQPKFENLVLLKSITDVIPNGVVNGDKRYSPSANWIYTYKNGVWVNESTQESRRYLYKFGNSVYIYLQNLVKISNLDSYINYHFGHQQNTLQNNQELFIGCITDLSSTTQFSNSRCIISQVNGIIEDVSVMIYVGGAFGTSESSVFYICNQTKGTTSLITDVARHNVLDSITNYSLLAPLAVEKGDKIYIKWITPTWVTKPTSIRQHFDVKIKTL